MNKCSKCNFDNFDDAVFCAGCGSPLEKAPEPEAAPPAEAAPEVAQAPEPEAAPAAPEAPAATPEPVPAQAVEPSAYSAYSAPAAPIAPAESNKATLWLILNIVATVLCCCANVFSIIGIIFSAIGMSSYSKGNYEDMRKKANVGKIMFIIGAICVVVGWIVSFVFPIIFSTLPFLSILPWIGNGSYYN